MKSVAALLCAVAAAAAEPPFYVLEELPPVGSEGIFSWPERINAAGQVVGWDVVSIDDLHRRAVFWDGLTPIDMAEDVPDVQVVHAWSINDAGVAMIELGRNGYATIYRRWHDGTWSDDYVTRPPGSMDGAPFEA